MNFRIYYIWKFMIQSRKEGIVSAWKKRIRKSLVKLWHIDYGFSSNSINRERTCYTNRRNFGESISRISSFESHNSLQIIHIIEITITVLQLVDFQNGTRSRVETEIENLKVHQTFNTELRTTRIYKIGGTSKWIFPLIGKPIYFSSDSNSR
jgi:hypothetical protein